MHRRQRPADHVRHSLGTVATAKPPFTQPQFERRRQIELQRSNYAPARSTRNPLARVNSLHASRRRTGPRHSVGGVTTPSVFEKVGRFTHTPHTPINVTPELATKTRKQTVSFHDDRETTFALPTHHAHQPGGSLRYLGVVTPLTAALLSLIGTHRSPMAMMSVHRRWHGDPSSLAYRSVFLAE
jgi:hypothetical protein